MVITSPPTAIHERHANTELVPETEMEKYGWDGLEFDHTQPSPLIWERDMHFVSKMFQENWTPERTWSRAWDVGQDLRKCI